jgi:hypothetical protein
VAAAYQLTATRLQPTQLGTPNDRHRKVLPVSFTHIEAPMSNVIRPGSPKPLRVLLDLYLAHANRSGVPGRIRPRLVCVLPRSRIKRHQELTRCLLAILDKWKRDSSRIRPQRRKRGDW